MKTRATTDVEPTAEDFARVDDGVKNARDRLRYALAKRYAEERARRTEAERRPGVFRRLLGFGRG